MATNVGELAYKVRFDARELTRGLLSTRQQMSASKKIMQEMQTPLEKYRTGLENLSAMSARYEGVAKRQVQMSQQLEKQYLEEESALRRLTKAERSRLELLKLPDAIKARNSDTAKAEARARVNDMNRRSGLRQQSRLAGIDEQQTAGRAALRDRLAAFRASKQANQAAALDRFRNSTAGESGAEHFGRFGVSAGSRALAAGRRGRFGMPPAMPLKATGMGMGGMAGGIGLKTMAGAGAAVGVALLVAKGVQMAKDLADEGKVLYASAERTAASFEVFTGSAAKARMLMDDMRKLSSISGATFESISDGGATMMSFGVSASEVSDKLKQMATITRGDSARLNSMALAFGQTTAAGKLMGQELLQMINAGFNPLQEISRTTGKDMGTLRKEMEQGKITVEMVANAFDSITAAGGRYHGMLEKISETSAGALSKESAAWKQAATDVGEFLAPLTKAHARLSTATAESLSNTVKQARESASAVSQLYSLTRESLGGTVSNRQMHAGREVEIRADPREEARKRARAALEATKAEQAARAKSIVQQQEDMKKFGLGQLSGMTASALQGVTPEGDYEKFNRMISLMDEVQKKRATIDFAEYRSLENVASYLDVEVQKELKKLEILEKQSKVRRELTAERDRLMDKGKGLNEQFADPGDKLRKELTDLQVMLSMGAITKETFGKARDQALNSSVDEKQTKVTSAPVLRVGSQEAYAALTGAKNAALERQMKEQQKQTKLQAEQVQVNKETNRILAEMKESGIGNAG